MKARPLKLADLVTRDGYPGIDANEWPVIRDWLRLFGELYDHFELDVRLGPGRPTRADDPPRVQRMWKTVTQLRADLIAWHGRDADVIEAKVNATVEATSQVRRYARLLALERSDVGQVTPVIICRTCPIAVEVSMHVSGGRAERIPVSP